MKRPIRFLAVSLVCILLFATFALAAGSSYTKEITASYVGVQLVVDGNPVVPKDADGNIVEPFIYEGTTYLPVRAVGEALGMPVSWDGSTKTVYIGNVPGEDIYLLDVCPPYETQYYESSEYMLMMGTKYRHGFSLESRWGNEDTTYAIFNLNGEYSTLEFDYGHVDNSRMADSSFDIYLDGKYSETIEGTPDMLVTHISIPLNHALQLKIVCSYVSDWDACYGFGNVTVS